MATESIETVLRRHTETLMSLPGVIGTAQGLCDGRPCIKVYVVEDSPALRRRIPSSLGGYPVKIEQTGPVRAHPRGGP